MSTLARGKDLGIGLLLSSRRVCSGGRLRCTSRSRGSQSALGTGVATRRPTADRVHARLQAAADLEMSKGAYAKFQATAKRRRLMKKAYEERIANKTHELVMQLRDIAGEETVDDEGSQLLYKTLKDTLNAFDNDGSAELGFPEYVEAWKFLGLQGSSQEIKKAFDSVDVDESGVVDWDEF